MTPDEGTSAPPPTDGPEPAPPDAAAPSVDDDVPAPTVEDLIGDLERLARERDEFLDTMRRTQADFENFRKQAMKRQADEIDIAVGRLVEDLLPVLDACDGAMAHGATDVEPVFAALLGTLEKGGLERIDPHGDEFDPTRHEAVMHEAGDGEATTVVTDVMRRGYAWKGRVVRPAMVKVRG